MVWTSAGKGPGQTHEALVTMPHLTLRCICNATYEYQSRTWIIKEETLLA
jgi:hypothetical protein